MFILHIRLGLPPQDRLPVQQQARQLTPVGFNSQFLALSYASFALNFAAPVPIQLNRNQCPADDFPSRWTAVHI